MFSLLDYRQNNKVAFADLIYWYNHNQLEDLTEDLIILQEEDIYISPSDRFSALQQLILPESNEFSFISEAKESNHIEEKRGISSDSEQNGEFDISTENEDESK